MYSTEVGFVLLDRKEQASSWKRMALTLRFKIKQNS